MIIPMKFKQLLLVGIILMVPGLILYAASTGKIAGRVVSSETGLPLPGVNVYIEDEFKGGVTDIEGDYYILAVSAGEYVVVASMMGYTTTRMVNVRVNIELTSTVDFELAPTVLTGQEVVVVAEQPVVELGVGNTKVIMDGAELVAAPALHFKDLLDRQAGVEVLDARGLIIRGSREHEISFRMDGMETRDALDNNIYVSLNPDAVERVEIQTGGFSSRYGQARAGVISVVTKEGGHNFSFTADIRTSIPKPKHFGTPWYQHERKLRLSEEAISNPIMTDSKVVWSNEPAPFTGELGYDTLAAEFIWPSWEEIAYDTNLVHPDDPVYGGFYQRPYLLQELYRWRTRPEVTVYGDKPDLNANFTFGGPLPLLPRSTFFLSNRYERSYYLVKASQDYYEDSGTTLKIASRLSESLKLVLTGNYFKASGVNRTDAAIGGLASGIDGLELEDPTKNDSRNIIDSPEMFGWFIMTRANDRFENEIWPYSELSVSTRTRKQLGFQLSHQLSASTYWEVNASFSRYDIIGRYDNYKRDTTATVTLYDPADPGYSVTLAGPYALAPQGYYRDDELWGGADGGVEAVTGVRLAGSYHNQEDSWATNLHLDGNVTTQANKRNLLTAGFSFDVTRIVKDEYRNYDIPERHWWQWDVQPKSGAFYVEDKLEFEGLVATFGLRTDLAWEDSWFDIENYPFQAWLSRSWVQLSEGVDNREYQIVPEDSRIKPIMRRPETKVAVAPRLAVSHPIGEAAKIYFNYGHFYQLPDPEKRYYRIRREAQQRGAIYRMGNPFMDFEKEIKYEFGYTQYFFNSLKINVSAYYRSITELAREFSYSGRRNDSFIILYLDDLSIEPDTVTYDRVSYSSWNNSGTEDVRGLELRIENRFGKYLTGSFNGTYRVNSAGRYGIQTVYQDTTREPKIFESILAQPSARPRFNLSMGIHTPAKFGPGLFGFQPFGSIDLAMTYWWKSQPRYDYNPTNPRQTEFRKFQNVQWIPHSATNMRLSKRFRSYGRITPVFYLQVQNLFNNKNMFRGAFRGTDHTRSEDMDNYLNSLKLDEGDQPGEYGQDYLYLPDPQPFYLFLNPRQIMLGFRVEM